MPRSAMYCSGSILLSRGREKVACNSDLFQMFVNLKLPVSPLRLYSTWLSFVELK